MRQMVCANCQSLNAVSDKYCKSCGFDLKLTFCPSCKTQTPVSAPICQKAGCGVSIRSKYVLACDEELPVGALEANDYVVSGKWRDCTLVEEENPNLSKLPPLGSVEMAFEGWGYYYDAIAYGDKRCPVVRLSKEEAESIVPFSAKWESASALDRVALVSRCLDFADELRRRKVWGKLPEALWSHRTNKIVLLRLREQGGEEGVARDITDWWVSLEKGGSLGKCFEEVRTTEALSVRALRGAVNAIFARCFSPTIAYAAFTDAGLKRELNEDNFLTAILEVGTIHEGLRLSNLRGLFAICDGMGGHEKGEIASLTVIQGLKAELGALLTLIQAESKAPGANDSRMQAEISKLIEALNDQVSALNRMEPDLRKRMGTTLVALLVFDHDFYAVHVGDSRLYGFEGETLTQLTEDHSVAMRELRLGNVANRKEAESLPEGKALTQALGPRERSFVHPGICHLRVEKEKLFLLCSDGLTDMVSDDEIRAVLAEDIQLQTKATRLIDMANQKGGIDNTTVILIGFKPALLSTASNQSTPLQKVSSL